MKSFMDDYGLLREYVRNRSQEAFRELVDRHLGMAYSAACRMVRDPHLAQEVVQNAFSTLARKADSVEPPQTVAGWLYNTTRHFAMHAVRTEQRRREREQTAVAMQALEQNADPGRITEHLEAAMECLDSSDRDPLVLRFLENRSLREVGAQLGISEDAARMRVNRALERLRGAFGKEGLTVTSVLLATTLSSNMVTAIPAGLGAAVASTALAGVAAGSLAQGAITTMNWFNLKSATALVGAAILTGTGTYFIQQRHIDNLSVTHQNLIAAQQKLTADREAALTAARLHDDELERLRKEAAEVHRLRNEVSQLRQQANAITALENDNRRLRQQLHLPYVPQTPQQIAEARSTAAKNACIANLRQIEGAKEMWALENKKTEGTATAGLEAAINAHFRATPACPGGGTYTYNVIGTAPTCSMGALAGHTL